MKKRGFRGEGAAECKEMDWSSLSKQMEKRGKSKKDDFKWDVEDVEESWSIDFDEKGRRIYESSESGDNPESTNGEEDLGNSIVLETMDQIAREDILRADGAFVTGEIDAKAVNSSALKKPATPQSSKSGKAINTGKSKVSQDDADAIRRSVDDKIVIKSEELKKKRMAADGKKVKVKVKKDSAMDMAAQSSKTPKTPKKPEVVRDVTAPKATKSSKSVEKYKNMGSIPSNKPASQFRKDSANWRFDGTGVADTTDEQIEETINNESFIDKIKGFTPVQYISVAMALIILLLGVMTSSVYAQYKGDRNKAEAFNNLPSFSDDEMYSRTDEYSSEDVFMEEAAAEPVEEMGRVLSLILTSVEKDLKIKLVDDTDTLVKDILWGVTVTDSEGDESSYDDEDMDGIIHLTDIGAGDYSVAINPSDELAGYTFPTIGQEVSVKAKVEYKVIANIRDEIKKESEVNAALEDNGNQAADVETGTAPADTVTWVESTEIAEGDEYEEAEVDLSKTEIIVAFVDRVKSAIGGFAKSVTKVFDRNYELASTRVLVADNEESSAGDGSSIVIPGFDLPADITELLNTTPTPTPTPTATPTPTPSAGDNGSAISSVAINKASAKIKAGESITLSLRYEPSGATPESVRWASDNTDIATVSDGVVTAIREGTARVGAMINGSIVVYCDVTVTDAESSDSNGDITISGPTAVEVGSTITLSAKCSDESASIKLWKSGDLSVAEISPNGNECTVKGIGEGTVTITAISSNSQEKTYSVTVSANTKEYNDNAQLYDSNKNKLYVIDGTEYRLAKYADYKSGNFNKFYRKIADIVYTGWQTIEGVTYYFTENHEKVTGDQVIGGVAYHFGDDGALSKNSGTLGIDVSKYQPSINWASVKASGINYVIIRCGYRGASTGVLIQDPYFVSHIKGAKDAGLKVGVYFFSTALNEAEAVEEASMCAELCSGYGINYPVFIDVEPSSRAGYNGLSVEQRTANIQAFCQTIASAGYTPGLYANKTWLTSYINTSSLSCKIWLAQYNAAGPTYTGHYDIWQYTSKGKVDGISGNVDMNQSYLGY